MASPKPTRFLTSKQNARQRPIANRGVLRCTKASSDATFPLHRDADLRIKEHHHIAMPRFDSLATKTGVPTVEAWRAIKGKNGRTPSSRLFTDFKVSPNMATQHYIRLGVRPPVTKAQLAAAYRAAALKHHPDRGGNAAEFAALNESYQVLCRHSGGGAYTPASLRSFTNSTPGDSSAIWGIMASIVLPTAIGMGVGIRMMYVGGERDGLRAGGTSRLFLSDTTGITKYSNDASFPTISSDRQRPKSDVPTP